VINTIEKNNTAEFPSASIAETSTGIDRMTIDKVCRGTGSLDGDLQIRRI